MTQPEPFDTHIYGNPGTDEWYTPSSVTTPILRAFGRDRFDLDPCSYDGQHLANYYITKEEDGLRSDWGTHDLLWINPPSGRPAKRCKDIQPLYDVLGTGNRPKSYSLLFWAKMISGGHLGAFLCYNKDTIQQSQKTLIPMTRYPILMLRDRVRYHRSDGTVGTSPMFSSAIVMVGEFDPKPLDEIGDLMVPLHANQSLFWG